MRDSAATDWIDLKSPATQELVRRVPRSTDGEVRLAMLCSAAVLYDFVGGGGNGVMSCNSAVLLSRMDSLKKAVN